MDLLSRILLINPFCRFFKFLIFPKKSRIPQSYSYTNIFRTHFGNWFQSWLSRQNFPSLQAGSACASPQPKCIILALASIPGSFRCAPFRAIYLGLHSGDRQGTTQPPPPVQKSNCIPSITHLEVWFTLRMELGWVRGGGDRHPIVLIFANALLKFVCVLPIFFNRYFFLRYGRFSRGNFFLFCGYSFLHQVPMFL